MVVIEVKTFQYIHYIPSQMEIYIKSAKVNLTPFESIFLDYLINNNGYCDMTKFEKYLAIEYTKKIKRKNIVVGVGRLKKKILFQTGYDILKCKYGFGYNIRT